MQSSGSGWNTAVKAEKQEVQQERQENLEWHFPLEEAKTKLLLSRLVSEKTGLEACPDMNCFLSVPFGFWEKELYVHSLCKKTVLAKKYLAQIIGFTT